MDQKESFIRMRAYHSSGGNSQSKDDKKINKPRERIEPPQINAPRPRPEGPRRSQDASSNNRPFTRRKNSSSPRNSGNIHLNRQKFAPRDGVSIQNLNVQKTDGPVLRYIPLGGLEEVGRNMSFFEYEDEIVIIDMGIQFPEDETPGVDFIIPNITYLEPKKQNIKAVVLTHGHYDHIGAIPYLTQRLGSVPIYTTALTKAIIEKRQAEFPNAPKLQIYLIKNGDRIRVGKHFELEFFAVAHTIPDTVGVLLATPAGNMVHFADFRIDYDAEGNPLGLDEIERVGKQGIHCFLVDSTNASKPGRSVSEKMVIKNLEELFLKVEGRIIVGMFSSLLTRIAEIIKIAEKIGRVIAIAGRSMKDNVQIAQNLGYIKVPKDLIVPLEEIHKYKDNKILILSTGAQGESNASLMRIVSGEHRSVSIKAGDSVVFSASVIPGNEKGVQVLRDNLARQGALVYISGEIDFHSSGHAPQDDLRLVLKALKPKYIVPVHGYFFMRASHKIVAHDVGIDRENVIMLDNGLVLEIKKEGVRITGEQVPAYYVMVDGLGVGDVGEVVLRDRKLLAQEGMIVIIVTIDRTKGTIIKNPDIISRGFIYLKENTELISEIRKKVRLVLGKTPQSQEPDSDYLKDMIRNQIGQYVYSKTHRRPMILPVILEI